MFNIVCITHTRTNVFDLITHNEYLISNEAKRIRNSVHILEYCCDCHYNILFQNKLDLSSVYLWYLGSAISRYKFHRILIPQNYYVLLHYQYLDSKFLVLTTSTVNKNNNKCV